MSTARRWTAADVQAVKNRSGARTKYNSTQVQIDGYVFDSKAEGRRYTELKAMVGAKMIHGLKVHPVFPIVYNETRICDVELDFAYFNGDWRIYEDVKGKDQAMSRLKRKLVEAFYSIHVELIR